MMTQDQQKALVAKITNIEIDDTQSNNYHQQSKSLSIELIDVEQQIPISKYILKQIWDSASFILTNCHVNNLLGGNYCVTERNTAYTVSKDPRGALACMCSCYVNTAGLCQHILVVAEKEKNIKGFIESYSKKKNQLGVVVNNNKPNLQKAKQSKPRKGSNNIIMKPITLVVGYGEAAVHDPEIDVPKPAQFQEIHHSQQ